MLKQQHLALMITAALAVTACSTAPTTKPAMTEDSPVPAPVVVSNPLLEPSPLYLQAPQWDKIKDSDYMPAFEAGMIAQKAPPGRRRCPPPSHHVLGDGRLADLNAELQQLAVDPRRTPEWVGAAHLPDQITNFAIE